MKNYKKGFGAKPKRTVVAFKAAPGQLFVVGIGASAGGLEALEEFFKSVPVGCGLAFVVVQHLAPARTGMLPELLQRSTAMPVMQAKDGMRVLPEHVYIIPPDRDLFIRGGLLRLQAATAPKGLRLPIDLFLRSLAEDRQGRAIGVILSGMGTDGTLGLRAIKEGAGATFVQTPASAKFDGMPRSAIEAGLADVTAPAAELPGRIAAYLRHIPSPAAGPEKPPAETDRGSLDRIVMLLRARTGHDFSRYKKSTIYRRVERRMGLHQLSKIEDYARYLRENPHESELLFKELLIGVTSFFRDPEVWERLKKKVIPDLLAAKPEGGELRAWVAGCSTGEEAYSLAIVFREVLEKLKPSVRYSLQIFATDLDKDAIDRARAGVYPANIAADVSETRLRRFFAQDERGYRVGKEVRESVIFARQNLIMDPPFTKLDLLTCRNLLIYLETELQNKVLPLFHYSLNPGGVLVLGSSETVGHASDLFTQLPGKFRLYRRKGQLRPELVDFPSGFSRRAETASAPERAAVLPEPNLQALTETLLLKSFSPAAVLTNDKGDILYVSGKTGKYLEPAAGKANLNVFAMAREGLGGTLNEAFSAAARGKAPVTLKAAMAGGSVDILVQPLGEPKAMRGLRLVVFSDSTSEARAVKKTSRPGAHDDRADGLRLELGRAREELSTTREEMQTSQEELKSTNEELQSTNEELQSTNEELTTSKEEMQSMNEELQTVNHELQAKLDELSRAGDDMKNLLNSTDIATLFLDEELRVRRFTRQAAGIIRLIPGDIGRPVTDLVSELDYPDMAADATEVLRSLVFHERQVSARGGRWFTARIMPYRTQDNRIDGVVITFTDVSAYKGAEAALKEASALLKKSSGSGAEELEAALQKALTIFGKSGLK
jgi:two-component system CheB/CheR fusion protein